MAGQIALGGCKVAEGGFRRREIQFQQLARGVVDIDQQAARWPALFKPGKGRAIQLHQLPTPRTPSAQAVRLHRLGPMRLPQVLRDHHLTNRFQGQVEVMHFGQLFMRQRRPKIGVVLPNPSESFCLDLGVQLVVARPTAMLGDQRLGPARSIGAPQTLDLPDRQAQVFRRLLLGDPFGFQLLHHFRSAQFARAHADEIAHSLRVLSWRASGPGYPRKSVPRLAPGASRRGHFYLGQRGHYYFALTLGAGDAGDIGRWRRSVITTSSMNRFSIRRPRLTDRTLSTGQSRCYGLCWLLL